MQTLETAGPRRYRFTFECGGEQIGALVGALIKETEGLNFTPAGQDRSKMTFVCQRDQMADIVAVILAEPTADHIIIRPDVPEQASRPFARPPVDGRPVDVTGHNVRVFAPTHPKLKPARGRALTVKPLDEGNPYRRIILQLARDKGIIHFGQIMDALVENNLSGANTSNVLTRMRAEGLLFQPGRGAYRLPTEEETAELLRRRQVMAGTQVSDQQPADGKVRQTT